MTYSIARERLASNLKIFRKLSGKTFQQISIETGLTISYLYYLENPKNGKNPSMEILDLLATYYGVDVQMLFQKI